MAAWGLSVHALLPPAFGIAAKIDPAVPLGIWGAVHLGFPVFLFAVRRHLAGQWVEVGLLVALGHAVSLVSAAVTAAIGGGAPM